MVSKIALQIRSRRVRGRRDELKSVSVQVTDAKLPLLFKRERIGGSSKWPGLLSSARASSWKAIGFWQATPQVFVDSLQKTMPARFGEDPAPELVHEAQGGVKSSLEVDGSKVGRPEAPSASQTHRLAAFYPCCTTARDFCA